MDSNYRNIHSPYGYACDGGEHQNTNRRCSRSSSRSRGHNRVLGYMRRKLQYNRKAESDEKDLYPDHNVNTNGDQKCNWQRDQLLGRDRERYQPDQRWKHFNQEQREPLFDQGRSTDSSRDLCSQNNNNNNSNEIGVDIQTNTDKDLHATDDDSNDSDCSVQKRCSTEPLNQIIIFGLKKHVTEANIVAELNNCNLQPSSVQVIRKRSTGASRGFAFVKFNTIEEASRWMDLTQGKLTIGCDSASLHYSITDWYCVKCGVYNFKRRFVCFLCKASRAESEILFAGAGEGIDEVSTIITKKIILRNLDALTNEESVLTALQKVVPNLVTTINKVIISRDSLTQISRGICYLNFETLVKSMDVHNALTALDPPLKIDERDIKISYCVDDEYLAQSSDSQDLANNAILGNTISALQPLDPGGHYTLADVPRLAKYSASIYASTATELAHYTHYYTDYYKAEITRGYVPQVTEANSGAAVALMAIQRKQQMKNAVPTAAPVDAAAVPTSNGQRVIPPKGNDGKTYPTPDVTQYQYDETSGYYYDPSTGLYYDAHSHYYYNNETGAYLYWDQRRSTYILATPASTQAALLEAQNEEASKKEKCNSSDKVKVAKKIIKDMEKWAKQLNQKRDMMGATTQPILPENSDSVEEQSTSRAAPGADICYSILEKKDVGKPHDFGISTPGSLIGSCSGSDSDSEDENKHSGLQSVNGAAVDEMDYVDFQKLTCLLCKRAFQSLDILQKHLKMSNLHKENLAKLKVNNAGNDDTGGLGLSYRDRAKERRLKYGEDDSPPPNLSRERFQNELQNLKIRRDVSSASTEPISSNNVGNRLLQKMGWSEGQGLGRKNQGCTQIIKTELRANKVGLGNTNVQSAVGEDYKTYIKKMMKSRYESI